jgi:hypothetical protein
MSEKKQPARPSPLIEIPKDLDPKLQAMAEEISRIHENVLWSAQGQFEQMKLWRAMNAVLGVPAAVLAAISGGTGLAARTVTAGPAILALIAAGFGAGLTTLNPSRRVSQSQGSANAYLELQTVARQLLTVDLASLSVEDARGRLTELTARRDEVNKTSDPPGWYAYWRASRNVNRGRQSHEVDQEAS